MGKTLAKFLGVDVPGPTKPTKFGGGFGGAHLSDSVGGNNPKNGATNARLQKSIDPEVSRKVLFGATAAAADVIYYERWNNKKNYDEIVVVAGHEINSFGSTFHYEGEALTFDGSGNNNERFGSNMNLKTRTLGVTATTLACGAGSIWTSSSSLTGCAFFSLRTIYTKPLFPNGVKGRYVLPCEGALVYDPRLDGVNPEVGGTGTHDYNDQSTWEYNDGTSDIGRNPSLQILWWLLGWKEAVSGIITCGKGVEPDDINMQSFIDAANNFDTLGWNSDCVLSMSDSDEVNLGILKAGCGATLTDAGGLYSIHAPVDDTATVAVAFTADDIVGSTCSWKPKVKMQQRVNSVSGSFIDPAALYQPRAYPKVIDTAYETADGFKKNLPADFQSVQDSDQAQEVNRIKLNQTRFEGLFKISVNDKGLIAKHYDVVTFTFDLYAFSAKKFRVKKQGISTSGYVELELQETDTSIYTGGTVNVLPAPSAGAGYNPSDEFAVTSLGAAVDTQTGTTGTISDGLLISWADPGDPVAWTEVEYKIAADSVWLSASPVYHPAVATSLIPLESGTLYDVRARHISVTGVIGPWPTVVQQTTGSNRDVQPGATDGGNVVSNQFPNAQMAPAGFTAHLSISTSDSFEAGSQTAIVSASSESIAAPPSPFGDDVLLIADGATGGAIFNNLFLLTDAGVSSLLAEDYVWGAYFINTSTTTTQRIGFPGGAGDLIIPANQTTWTWQAITTTETSSGTMRMELRTAPITDGKVYMVGAFFARGSFDLSSPPGAFGLMEQVNLLNNHQQFNDVLSLPNLGSGSVEDPTFEKQIGLNTSGGDFWEAATDVSFDTFANLTGEPASNQRDNACEIQLNGTTQVIRQRRAGLIYNNPIKTGDTVRVTATVARSGSIATNNSVDALKLRVRERDAASSIVATGTLIILRDEASASAWTDFTFDYTIAHADAATIEVGLHTSTGNGAAGIWWCSYFQSYFNSEGKLLTEDNSTEVHRSSIDDVDHSLTPNTFQDQGDGEVRSVIHGLEAGLVRDGDVVTFVKEYAVIPDVVFSNGGLTYDPDNLDGTKKQIQQFSPDGLSTTGFTATLETKEIATSLVGHTDGEGAGAEVAWHDGNTGPDWQAGKEETVTVAWNNQYQAEYDVRVLAGPFEEPTDGFVEFYYNKGSGWVLGQTRKYTTTGTLQVLTGHFITMNVSGLTTNGSGEEYGMDVSGLFTTLDDVVEVTWDSATAPATTTSTPAGVNDIKYEVKHNKE